MGRRLSGGRRIGYIPHHFYSDREKTEQREYKNGAGCALLTASPARTVRPRPDPAVWTFRRGDEPKRFQIFLVGNIFRWPREPSSCNEPRKWSHYTFRVAR